LSDKDKAVLKRIRDDTDRRMADSKRQKVNRNQKALEEF